MSTDSRWQRLGLDHESMMKGVANVSAAVSKWIKIEPGWDASACLSFTVRDDTAIACYAHLELARVGDPGQLGRRVPPTAVEYFFGQWRQNYEWAGAIMPPEQIRARKPWFDTYREGLLMGLCFDDAESVRKLVQWPARDLWVDDGAFDLSKEDNYFIMLLSLFIREDHPDEQERLRELIRKGRRKRPKLLLATLEAIAHENLNEFRKALAAVADYHGHKEFWPDHSLQAVMVEGSMLWHVARQRGMICNDLDLDIMDRIVRAETIDGS